MSRVSSPFTAASQPKARARAAGQRGSLACAAVQGMAQQGSLSSRRAMLCSMLVALPASSAVATEKLSEFEPMEGLKGKDYGKSRMRYNDYVTTQSGLQYQELKEGSGETPLPGDTVVIDWAGYTIGYYGRPFEARNKPKGSSFVDDNKEYFRFKLGSGSVVPAIEEAVASMKPGAIRRLIVPVELGYADNDWHKQGPPPTTFAGQRALDFVLSNKGMIDKTLLFDIELMRVQRQ